ncbi:Molybdenum cofactor guanylyltransferase [Metallosphaera sp. J1]|uniref:nucleotidyltransferase family protein n=1 Tax=Metallosphaera TaxID=41980 RepID=UPI001EDD54D7|nr:nucleotidyltransferase family protein [Metallosphaera javensis (ex Hofmann et al. 2022)]MCG3108375.1 Molybdenum cofactor guanylyltransferase [Metallosphaera javensis (ex Hofmann et al. 2022)]BCS92765.1 MAG: 4-diphosphocytidyl-2C-methyl-D-erythritol kinase [Metallosphaera javensis (ex Sakai et al. 2022)]
MNVIGILVLAGGEGSRFRGNKLLAKIKDVPVLGLVLNALPRERVIVAGKYAPEIIAQFPDEIILYNPYWKNGISTSLKLGIRYFRDSEGVLVVLGDMPLITKDTISKILNHFSPSCSAVVPVHEGEWGNPVLLSKKLFDQVDNLTGDVGAKNILKKRSDLCFVECGEEVLIDVDTEADLIEVSRRLS